MIPAAIYLIFFSIEKVLKAGEDNDNEKDSVLTR